MGATDIAVLDGLDTDAAELRAALEAFQPGVYASTSLKVSPRGAGSNRSIDLASGRAVIASPSLLLPTWAGTKYWVAQEVSPLNSDAFELGGIQAPHPTYTRMDQIIARLYDNEGGLRKWRPEVLKGLDPTQNATLDNRHNAAALPVGVPVLRLADVLVPTTGIITATEIRDRRSWARGALYDILQSGPSNYSTTTGVAASIDATNLTKRLECTGGLVEVSLAGGAWASGADLAVDLFVDGVQAGRKWVRNTGGVDVSFNFYWGVVPSAGSHVFDLQFWVSVGSPNSGGLHRDATYPLIFKIEEKVRQNTSNN